MSEKWTKGPWEVCNGTDIFTACGAPNSEGLHAEYNDGWQIADCSVGVTFVDGEYRPLISMEQSSNARLIAQSPAMYKALEPFAQFACSPPGECDCHNCHARDVLAKARGEN